MSNVTLNLEQYLALLSMARRGATSPDHTRTLEAFLKDIDRTSGITRYTLLVQWQELNSPLPPNTRFPDVWPPEMRATMERTDRPIAKADVLALVKDRARNGSNILVTKDLGGIVGWTKVEEFFIT